MSSHEELDLSEDLRVSSQVTGRWLAGANLLFFLSTTSVVPLFLSSMAVPGFDFAQGSETLATSQLSHVKCSSVRRAWSYSVPLRVGYGCASSGSSGWKKTIRPRYLPTSPSQRACSWSQEQKLRGRSHLLLPRHQCRLQCGSSSELSTLRFFGDSLLCIP